MSTSVPAEGSSKSPEPAGQAAPITLGGMNEPAPLLPLRPDLQLTKKHGGFSDYGGYVLFDGVRNRYFQLSEQDFRLLGCWSDTAEKIQENMQARFGQTVSPEQIDRLARWLIINELVEQPPEQDFLAPRVRQKHRSLFSRMLHGYLFFRVPLLHPDPLLTRLFAWIRPWLRRETFVVWLLLTLVGFFLVSREFQVFVSSYRNLMNLQGAFIFLVTLSLIKVCHEFGHGLACKYFGLRVSTMGVAFLVMWPVLYTDTSDAWKLDSARKRVMIDIAGVAVELWLATIAMLMWPFLPEGTLRDMAFVVAATTWVTSVLVNLNPLMRFDGYYLFSDLLDIPNLQERSFAEARWFIRQKLFGVPYQSKEPVALRKILVAFGFAVWVYRFFLFLGIAILVYHLFFKVLGVLLFAVEIYAFIMKPIFNELKQWPLLYQGGNSKKRFLAVLAMVLLVLFVPFSNDIRVPAAIRAAEMQVLFSESDGYIAALMASNGERVEAGSPLLELNSPDLAFQLEKARREVEKLKLLLSRLSTNSGAIENRLVLLEQVAEAQARVTKLQDQKERLLIRAPFSGVVEFDTDLLQTGVWVSADTPLMSIRGDQGLKIIGYFEEHILERLNGEAGRFIPANLSQSSLPVTLQRLEASSIKVLQDPKLASIYGGPIEVIEQDQQLIPEHSVYRGIFLEGPDESSEAQEKYSSAVTGTLVLEGKAESLAWPYLRHFISVLIRESGF